MCNSTKRIHVLSGIIFCSTNSMVPINIEDIFLFTKSKPITVCIIYWPPSHSDFFKDLNDRYSKSRHSRKNCLKQEYVDDVFQIILSNVSEHLFFRTHIKSDGSRQLLIQLKSSLKSANYAQL